MKKKCKLEFFYVRNGDKTAPNTPDEVYSHNTTESENIHEILTKYIFKNLPGNYSTSEIKFCMLLVIKYTNNPLFLIICQVLFYTITFIFLLIWCVSFLTHTKNSLKELRNCILWIIPVWSLFCSVRVYKSLHFLPILLVKLGVPLSMF